MLGVSSWIPNAVPGERSSLNPNGAGRGGLGILLANRYAMMVSTHGTLYEYKVVWIKLERMDAGNIGIACVYVPNIPSDRRHL